MKINGHESNILCDVWAKELLLLIAWLFFNKIASCII